MPLPSDEKILALSQDLIAQFDKMFGLNPGFRPSHAKGVLLQGEFTPSTEAANLSTAPHFQGKPTQVTARFSNSTGLPLVPDNDPNANPRGLAIRFHLGEHVHTDIVSHSTKGFPTRTGAEFMEFLHAVTGATPLDEFFATHPAALAFAQTPKPSPASFVTEQYFGVTAMEFIHASGHRRFGRYRITPELGIHYLSTDEASALGPNYLVDGMLSTIATGQPLAFRLEVQLAEPGDVVDDATIHWPDSRLIEDLGGIVLTHAVPDDAAAQQHIIFDPIPRVQGIEPSNDPLLELRAAIYLISGRRRRSI